MEVEVKAESEITKVEAEAAVVEEAAVTRSRIFGIRVKLLNRMNSNAVIVEERGIERMIFRHIN